MGSLLDSQKPIFIRTNCQRMRRKLVNRRPGHIRSRRAKKAAIPPIFVLHPSGRVTHFSDRPALVCRGWFP